MRGATLASSSGEQARINSTPSPRDLTLIELMAVVAIIALMAVPSYHDKYNLLDDRTLLTVELQCVNSYSD